MLDRQLMDGHSARVEPNPAPTRTCQGPRILLVEDDPASTRFLTTALEAQACRVRACATGRHALDAARTSRFDLLLIDCTLPDMDGLKLLASLRREPDAASGNIPAVATSAEWDEDKQAAMLKGGFAAILAKPCSSEELRQVLEAHIDPQALPVRHDGAALEAVGSAANLAALRRLFARELAALSVDLAALQTDPAQLTERLHRLCASAGFCGAPALAAATRRWLQRLRAGEDDTAQRRQFEHALEVAGQEFSAARS